jgi:hypothetical protein
MHRLKPRPISSIITADTISCISQVKTVKTKIADTYLPDKVIVPSSGSISVKADKVSINIPKPQTPDLTDLFGMLDYKAIQ